MDLREVSSNREVVQLFQRAERNAERALRKKGQRVRDHPPPGQVVSKFISGLLATSTKTQVPWHTATWSLLPRPYAPCVRSVSDLKPIAIADMKLETRHRGKKTIVHVRTPSRRTTAVMAVVEDENGTAVLLQLYFQPDESVISVNNILRPNSVYILKEPFFVCPESGVYALRVDHVGDIVRLEPTDERIPPQWRRSSSTSSGPSEDVRARGNEAVQEGNWAEAHRWYSSAIQAAETSRDKETAYLNRSLANLKLQRPEKALLDARMGTNGASTSEKGLYRKARALYELGDFDECVKCLQNLLASHPGNRAAKEELNRAQERLHERKTGAYNFSRMYGQTNRTPPLVDCATFSSPVEVRPSPGRGRGLFTKVPVSAGQLLVCEKSFAYSYVNENHPAAKSILMNVLSKKAFMGGQARLLTLIVQKLYHSPRALKAFNELYHGDYVAPAASEVDGHPVVDLFLVEQIRALNSFGAPTTTLDVFMDRDSMAPISSTDEEVSHINCGIWLLASRINHSCVQNCTRSFIGDVQIIRAGKDLDAGAELFFSYRTQRSLQTYDDVQKSFDPWGFTCSCELCVGRKATSKMIFKRRKALFENLGGIMGDNLVTFNITAAKRLLAQIEKTCSTTKPNNIQLELRDLYFTMGIAFISLKEPEEAISMFLKSLESLGFKIRATIPGDISNQPQFNITKWGLTNDFTLLALINLFTTCKGAFPQFCGFMKKDMHIGYRIVIGEGETMSKELPMLV